ncbi:hypothetical protein [Streptomyces gilvosporeus]|uniref:hypothetical protein n=1 Tax=Streptomyces gilvosporeus TaxID=553510 RepID=UPI00131BC3C8|nr:hypothetical protein [Streptomyces gilvosporeus]
MTRTLPLAAAVGLTTSAVVSHSTVAVTLAVCLVGVGVVLGCVVLLLLAVTSVWSSQPERRKNAFKVLNRLLSFAHKVIRPKGRRRPRPAPQGQPPQAAGRARRRRRTLPGDQ